MKRHTSHTKHDVLTSLRVLFLYMLPADLLKMSHYKLCFNLFIEDLTANLLSSRLPGFQKQCNCPNRSKTMTYLFFFRREFYMRLENPNSVLTCRALGLKVGFVKCNKHTKLWRNATSASTKMSSTEASITQAFHVTMNILYKPTIYSKQKAYFYVFIINMSPI